LEELEWLSTVLAGIDVIKNIIILPQSLCFYPTNWGWVFSNFRGNWKVNLGVG
jgi:hypothetical protein